MNAYANRNRLAVLLLALLTVFSAGAVLASDASEADDFNPNDISASGFKEDKSGTLTIPMTTDGPRTVNVLVQENGRTLVDRTFTEVEGTVSLKVSFELGVGTHNIDVFVKIGSDAAVPKQLEITVDEDIWSNIGTYIAIVVVAIVVIVIVVLYMRAKPNNKPTTTFTQLEEEKKAAAAATEKEKAAPKTEKIKYTSSRRK